MEFLLREGWGLTGWHIGVFVERGVGTDRVAHWSFCQKEVGTDRVAHWSFGEEGDGD